MYGSYRPSVLKYICQYKIDFVMYSWLSLCRTREGGGQSVYYNFYLKI
jgi:hypothetical protein